jgi:hypothetical protein
MRLMNLLSPEQFERYLEIQSQRDFGPGRRRREHTALLKYIANLPLNAFAPEDQDKVVELLWPEDADLATLVARRRIAP